MLKISYLNYINNNANIKNSCSDCIEFYEKKDIKKMHKKHNNVQLIFYDINEILKLKLFNTKFCRDLLKGLQQEDENEFNIRNARIAQDMRKYLNLLFPKQNRNCALFIDGVAIYNSSTVLVS